MASLKFLAIFAILLVCCSMLTLAQDMDMDDSGIRVKRQWGWGGRGGWGGGWGNRGWGGWGGRGGWGNGGWGRGGYGGYGWGR